MNSKLELLEILEQQEKMITKQNEAIASLINENVEQECIIKELMRDVVAP